MENTMLSRGLFYELECSNNLALTPKTVSRPWKREIFFFFFNMKVGKTFGNKNKSIIYCCNISYLIISLSYRKVKFCPVSLVTGSKKFTSIKPLLTKMYRINQAVLWSICPFISKHNTSPITHTK